MRVHTIKNDLLQSCTYLLYDDTDFVFLVDCGEPRPIIEWLDENHKVVNSIFITHCHYDHIYGLSEIFKYNPHAQIFASSETILGLRDENKNLSYIIGDVAVGAYISNVHVIEEGNSHIGTLQVETFYTPGHSDDCYCYIIENKIFTGDSYIPHAKVFAKWPSSNRDLALKNETRIKDIIKQRNLTVYSGHWY